MSVLIDGTPTTCVLRPRSEGANIQTWIGFKHFMYLAEEAVLTYLWKRGYGPETLFRRYGLGVEIVDSSVSLPARLGVDDAVNASVSAVQAPDGGVRLDVTMTVLRDHGVETVLGGRVRLALVREAHAVTPEPVPAELLPYVVDSPDNMPATGRQATLVPAVGDVRAQLAPAGTNAILWSTRIPYYYCHYSTRLRHSGYVRLLEEAVDRFLADRGISVRTMLETNGWVPVVSRARVRVLAQARMEERLHTVFAVRDVIKNRLYQATMDCYVEREGLLVHTGTATITHGYVVGRGDDFGQLVEFDPATVTALTGGAA